MADPDRDEGTEAIARSEATARRHREIMAAFGLRALRGADLDTLLHEACKHAAAGLGVEHAKVLEYRAETDDLLVRAGVGWAAGVVGRARLPSDMASPPGRAFRTGEAVFIENLAENPEFEYSDLLREHGIVALVNVPIRADGFTFGVLEADADAPRLFTADDRNFLTGFANLVAAAVERQRADGERERLMRELTKAKEAAEAAVASKNRVLAATGHDLKQPLQIVVGCLERLPRLRSESERRHYRDRALQAAEKLNRGLDFLLDVARIESGIIAPRIEPIALGALLVELTEDHRPAAESAGLQLRLVATELRVCSDRRLLSHILQNLIGNAVKYTERGRVLVGTRRRSDAAVIEIHDTGIGIPEDQLGRIFEEFHRLEVARAEGFGLGLAIVKRMTDLLGHRLTVRSVPGKGTRFAVEVPIEKA